MTDSSYLSQREVATLAEDVRYQAEVQEQCPTVFFRPGDRTTPDHSTYELLASGQTAWLGFITQYGSHASKTPPQFATERPAIEIVSRQACALEEVTEAELAAAYQEIDSQNALRAWLQEKYPNESIDSGSVVTVYHIKYL